MLYVRENTKNPSVILLNLFLMKTQRTLMPEADDKELDKVIDAKN